MRERDGVESSLTSTVKQNSPRGLVLNTEKMTVKLNKHIIIGDKVMNRKKMFADVWNMKDVF